MIDLTIIGGGMAGLAAAWAAQKRGLRYRLIEAGERLGGKIVSERVEDGLGDWLVEGGPDSFLVQKPEGLRLCRELGLESEFLDCTPTTDRVCILDGGLVPIPEGARLFIPVDAERFRANGLLSAEGTERALAERDVPPRQEEGDESLGDFITRRFGGELLEKLAGPVLAGIYGADPWQLSVGASFARFHRMEREHGSLMAAVAQAPARRASLFTTLRGGMARMVDAMEPELTGEVVLGERVDALPQSGRTGRFGRTVLALPAREVARLVPELAEDLSAFRTASTGTVSLAYDRGDMAAARGYGFMSVLSDPSPLVGCTFVSNKFAARSPEEGFLVRAFVGGQKDPERLMADDDSLAGEVAAELNRLLGTNASPKWQQVSRWINGNPQYDVGHLERVAELEKKADARGLALIGSPYRGVGLSDCIRQAESIFS